MDLDSEIVLLFEILKSSPNGKIINPKMKTSHFSKALETSDRTIQRYMVVLIEKGFICNGEIQFEDKKTLKPIKQMEEEKLKVIQSEFSFTNISPSLILNLSETG